VKLRRHGYQGRLVRLAPTVLFLAIVFTAWFAPILQTSANGVVTPSAATLPRVPSTTIPATTIPVTIPATTIPLVVPTSVTIPVTIPASSIPLVVPTSVTIPIIPSSIPTNLTIPNIPSSIPTVLNIPSSIPIPKSLSSLPTSVTIPKSLSSVLASVTIPNIPSSLPASVTIPKIPSSIPSVITIPNVSLPTTLDDELINSLSSDLLSNAEVASIVDEISEDTAITNDIAAVFATSVKVLEKIDGTQADQIFSSLDTGSITDAQGEAIVETVQVASKTIRRSFEGNVNVFGGKFDNYVPLNSKIDVEDRRTVVAVSVVSTAALTSMGVRGAMPMGGGAPGGGGSAELAEAFKSESSRIRRISKYKYENGRRVVDKKNFARRLVLSIMQNSFTLVGFIVVYLTLSGSVRTIAGLATLIAFFSTLYIDMREED